jgi:hypothetical protein
MMPEFPEALSDFIIVAREIPLDPRRTDRSQKNWYGDHQQRSQCHAGYQHV